MVLSEDIDKTLLHMGLAGRQGFIRECSRTYIDLYKGEAFMKSIQFQV